jgi:hypothetical protein
LRYLPGLLAPGGSLILLACVNIGLVVEEIALLGSVVGGDETFIVRHVDVFGVRRGLG